MTLTQETIDNAVAAYAAGGRTMKSVSDEFGIHVVALSAFLELRGIRKWQRAPKNWEEDGRLAAMIELRRAGWPLRDIGRKFHRTGERVRQIFVASGNDWATGSHAKLVRYESECLTCGEDFSAKTRGRQFCSRTCHNNYLSPTSRSRIEKIIECRKRGMSWTDTAASVGISHTPTGSGIVGQFKSWCNKAGIDPKPYLGWNVGKDKAA